MPRHPDPPQPESNGWFRPRMLGLHLVALSGLGLALPLLSVLGENPTFFVAHQASPLRIVAVGLAVVLLPPMLALAACAAATMVGPRTARGVALVGIGGFALLLGVQVLDPVIGSDRIVVVAALGASVGAAALYRRSSVARDLLTFISPAPLLFLGLFLFASPVAGLVLTTSVEPAAVAASGNPPPVIVLVLDELPTASVLDADGDLDTERFPNLARLADDGTWYPNVTTVAAYTHEAVPPILTGRFVGERGTPPTASAHGESLFTLLADTYRITALEQTTQMCDPAICDQAPSGVGGVGLLLADLTAVWGRVALPDDLDAGIPPVDESWTHYWRGGGTEPLSESELDAQREELVDFRESVIDNLPREDRIGELTDAIAAIDASDEPMLQFLHVSMPHTPWVVHADGSFYGPIPQIGLVDHIWTDQAASDFGRQRHLLQAQAMDRLIGDLLGRLDELGIYDEAVVVVTADHGVSFEVGTHRRRPEATTFTPMMGVPLLVKPPAATAQNTGSVDARPAQTIDIMPTIAELVGIEVPWAIDGTSLLGERPSPVERGIYYRGESFATDEEQLSTTAQARDAMTDLFGDPLDLYALGGSGDLLGTSTSELSPAEAFDGCWTLTGAADPVGTGTIGWLSGSISTTGPQTVAVAVNGEMAATARSSSGGKLLVVTDPEPWHDADNRFELFALEGVGGEQIRPIARCD